MQLEPHRRVFEHHELIRTFKLRIHRLFTQQAPGRAQGHVQELDVVRVRDDRRPFPDERQQPSGVVRVRMRIHDIPDRLVRNHALDFIDDLLAASFGRCPDSPTDADDPGASRQERLVEATGLEIAHLKKQLIAPGEELEPPGLAVSCPRSPLDLEVSDDDTQGAT